MSPITHCNEIANRKPGLPGIGILLATSFASATTVFLRMARLSPGRVVLVLLGWVMLLTGSPALAQQSQGNSPEADQFKKISFPSKDQLTVTGDLYLAHSDKKTPFIVLCHQAGWSRGEYREIAPKLNKAGFNCLAIDQRSGKAVNQVTNETAVSAKKSEKATGFVDAEQDMISALEYVRKNHAEGKVILWGSSYSSALSLRIAGEHPELVDGVLAFAPGEYFQRFGQPADWITTSAKKIKVPAFVTSAKHEYKAWKEIYKAIPGDSKSKFVPETRGNHGSRALWDTFDDSPQYWKSVNDFLKQFQN